MKKRFNNLLLSLLFILLIMPSICFAEECTSCLTPYDSSEAVNSDNNICWVCGIFEHFFDIGNRLAYVISIDLLTISKAILAIGLGIWLVFHLMPILASLKAGNPGQIFTKIGGIFFKALIVATFLTFGLGTIYDYVITPVTGFTSAISKTVMSTNSVGNTVFDSEIKSDMIYVIAWAFKDLKYGQRLASFMICHSKVRIEPLYDYLGIEIKFVDPKRWLIGASLWVVFSIMLVVFPFFIIDALFKLLIICMLLPLFMVAWVFPATKSYADKAFNLILGCLMTFSIMGLVIKITLKIIMLPLSDKVLVTDVDTGTSEEKNLLDMCAAGDQDELFKVLSDDKGLYFSSVIVIIICGVISLKYIAKVGDIVSMFGFNKVDNSGGSKMLSYMQRTAGAVAGTAVAVAGTVAGGVKDKFGGGGKSSSSSDTSESRVGKFAEKATDTASKGIEKGGKAAGEAVEKGGKALGEASKQGGNALIDAGTGLSGTGIGAIAGVPMMIAGGAMVGAGVATEAGSKVAAEVIKASTKVAAKAMNQAKKVRKAAGKKAKEYAKKKIRDVGRSIESKIYGDDVAGALHDARDAREAKSKKGPPPPKKK